MKMTNLIGSVEQSIRNNSSTILTAFGVSGVVTTAYLASVATVKAHRIIEDDECISGTAGTAKQRLKERVPLVWKLYIPTAISGAATIGCVVGAQRIGNRKTAAAQAAFTLTERAYSEYRDKVVEHIGESKEQKIRDEVAQDQINRADAPTSIVVTGPGNVLCFEALTGRYFNCDMETLRKAQNDINAKLVAHDWASLDDFYHIVGLEGTAHSWNYGWTSDRLMELKFSTTLSPDGRPCLSFDYNYSKVV